MRSSSNCQGTRPSMRSRDSSRRVLRFLPWYSRSAKVGWPMQPHPRSASGSSAQLCHIPPDLFRGFLGKAGPEQGNHVLISAAQQVGAKELALPVYRGCFFLFRSFPFISAIPGWPLVQSRPTGMSVGFCLPSVICIEHMLYKRCRLGKGRVSAK